MFKAKSNCIKDVSPIEPIVSREVFDKVQTLLYERGQMSREGRKFSQHYWYSSRIYCGKCGWAYGVTGNIHKEKRSLRCVNRAKYGANPRIDSNGAEVDCDSKGINENVLAFCMKYILERIQISRSEIVSQLLAEIQRIQQDKPSVNVEPLKAEIENLGRKKRKAIDLMLDELISKDDIKKQTKFYDSEIARLTEQIAAGQDVSSAHLKQIDGIRNYY